MRPHFIKIGDDYVNFANVRKFRDDKTWTSVPGGIEGQLRHAETPSLWVVYRDGEEEKFDHVTADDVVAALTAADCVACVEARGIREEL